MVYEAGNRTIDDAVSRVVDGDRLDRRDGIALLARPVDELTAAADAVRTRFGDGTVDACSIVDAKAGDCAEDCGFRAQSPHFDTGIDAYGLLDPERYSKPRNGPSATGHSGSVSSSRTLVNTATAPSRRLSTGVRSGPVGTGSNEQGMGVPQCDTTEPGGSTPSLHTHHHKLSARLMAVGGPYGA